MTEGTKSVLFGCHSLIHSFMVLKSWVFLYKNFPTFWQIMCIFIHDIGYIGTNYLTERSNNNHAELGAKIGKIFFGEKAWLFLIGHSRSASKKYKIPLSKLEAPDDYSWIIAPKWFLKWNMIAEPGLHGEKWREAVKENWSNGINNRKSGFELAKELFDKEL